METINMRAICITFVLEWHGEMFIIFHRGNMKKNYNHSGIGSGSARIVIIRDVMFPVEVPIFSIRHQILSKFVNDAHDKYNVYQILDDNLVPLQRHVARVAIKELSPVCHTWNSKGRPVP